MVEQTVRQPMNLSLGTRRRLARIAFRRNPVLLLVPVLLLIAGFQGRSDQVPGLFLWTIASFSIGQAAALLGPIVGGIAAYMGGYLARGATGSLLRSLADRGVRVHLLILAATAFWITVTWAGYIVYQIVLGFALADWGFLDAMPVMAGFAIILMTVSVGYVLGMLFPGRYTPVFVGAGMFLLFIAIYMLGNDSPQLQWMGIYDSIPGTGSQQSFKYLSPMQIFSGSVSTPVATSWGTIGPRFIGWMLGLTAVSLGVLGWLLGRRLSGAVTGSLGALLAAASAVSLLSLPASEAELPKEEVAYQEICRGEPIQVCVHPAYETNLEPTIRIANEVLGPIAGLTGVPERIEQFGTGPRGDRVFQIYFEDTSVDQIAMSYLGVLRDFTLGEQSPGQSVIGYWLFTRAVEDPDGYWLGAWLPERQYFSETMNQPPTRQLLAAVGQWRRLSQTEQRTWLEQNWDDLIHGRIGWNDLP